MTCRISRIVPEDWQRCRELRLRMLRDTPLAYLERHEDAVRLSEEEWRERARGWGGPQRAGFAAVAATGEWAGMMAGSAADRDAAAVYLESVWVAPEHRGARAGVADLLLDAVVEWARAERGAGRVLLEVHESNTRAIAYYRRRGFRETGRTTPYPLDPEGRELEMVLPL